MNDFASRAGEKLEFALQKFDIDVKGKVCADFGSNTGGFVDVLLKRGAKRVYSIDTGYGVLDWKLRNDKRVVVMERTNAMHVDLPDFAKATTGKAERMDLISIDVGWTPQTKILPNAIKNLKDNGDIVSLIKPHYEATARKSHRIKKGKLSDKEAQEVLGSTLEEIKELRLEVKGVIESPITGDKAGNKEWLALIKKITTYSHLSI